MMQVNTELREYVESHIIPRYDCFDQAHQRDHVITRMTTNIYDDYMENNSCTLNVSKSH